MMNTEIIIPKTAQAIRNRMAWAKVTFLLNKSFALA